MQIQPKQNSLRPPNQISVKELNYLSSSKQIDYSQKKRKQKLNDADAVFVLVLFFDFHEHSILCNYHCELLKENQTNSKSLIISDQFNTNKNHILNVDEKLRFEKSRY